MVELLVCPQCGAQIPADADTRGLCPFCLLERGLNYLAHLQSHAPAGAPRRPRFAAKPEAPSIKEVSELFPELEIIELLGQGGMGAVYKARQRTLDRLVAVKLLFGEMADDVTFAKRFLHEARILARLTHPHVVSVHDFGQRESFYYFLMEFVPGLNLRRALASGRLPQATAVRIAADVASALAYAHAQGVVHRDIKPENILIEQPEGTADGAVNAPFELDGGKVKIVDFGVAKVVDRRFGELTLTGPQHIFGTPFYMAPEQGQPTRRDESRVDQYALGVVLYEMLTGQIPRGRFPLPSEVADVDRRLDAIVLRCLETDPAKRFESAAQLETVLRSALSGRPGVPAVSVKRGRGVRIALLAASIPLIIAAIAAAIWWGTRSEPAGNLARTIITPQSGSPALPEKPAKPPVADPVAPETPGTAVAPPSNIATLPSYGRPFGRSARDSFGPTFVRELGSSSDAQQVELTSATLSGEAGKQSLEVVYRFKVGFARPGASYYWVVAYPDGRRDEERIITDSFETTGTLKRLWTFDPGAKPGETYVEMEDFGPFESRRRVSNVLKLDKPSRDQRR